jgi:hypothetical protein
MGISFLSHNYAKIGRVVYRSEIILWCYPLSDSYDERLHVGSAHVHTLRLRYVLGS